MQDSPPGSAAAALSRAPRSCPPAGWTARSRSTTRARRPRSSPPTSRGVRHRVSAGERRRTEGDDRDGGARARRGFAEPVELAVAAISDALDGRTLSRDDLHEQLRRRLPKELLPWCEGCKSHHARRGLLVMAGLHGRLCIAGRAGRQPVFGRTDQLVGWDPPAAGAGAELVRRYLRGYGPSSPAHFAEWAGIGKAHARRLWVDDWTPPADPPAAEGVRLLATGDPLLLSRDRETVVPDPGNAQEGLDGGRRRRRGARGRPGGRDSGARASRASDWRSPSTARCRAAHCARRPSGWLPIADVLRWRYITPESEK